MLTSGSWEAVGHASLSNAGNQTICGQTSTDPACVFYRNKDNPAVSPGSVFNQYWSCIFLGRFEDHRLLRIDTQHPVSLMCVGSWCSLIIRRGGARRHALLRWIGYSWGQRPDHLDPCHMPCPPRCGLDRPVHQPTQWSVANVAHLAVTHPGGHAHLWCQQIFFLLLRLIKPHLVAVMWPLRNVSHTLLSSYHKLSIYTSIYQTIYISNYLYI